MATDLRLRSDPPSHENLWDEIEAIARDAQHVRLSEERMEAGWPLVLTTRY